MMKTKKTFIFLSILLGLTLTAVAYRTTLSGPDKPTVAACSDALHGCSMPRSFRGWASIP